VRTRLREDGVFEVEVGGEDYWPERVSDGLLLSCSICGRNSNIDYVVDENLWGSVVPEQVKRDFVCIECFGRLAERAGVNDWPRYVYEIQVCGEGATAIAKPSVVVVY